MVRYYYEDIEKVLSELSTSEEGLSSDEAEKRLQRYGCNKLVEQKKTNYLARYFTQFTDLLAVILLVAALFSFLLGAPKDALVILVIVFVNASIGFFQEFKAEKAIEALKKYVPQTATVIRDNNTSTVNSKELVPGDIIVLSEGIKVPADIRLLTANELSTDDSAITGESTPQEKRFTKNEDEKTGIGDICGTILMGTIISSGNGTGVVIATGMETEFGKIAKVTTEQHTEKSPLQIETDRIAKSVAKATFWVVLLLMAIYSFLNGKFILAEAFEFSIGIASALVPEGLAATVSIALALGVQKMTRRKAVMRRLSAVETLGEANVIVTDKTGTLTRNQMTVKEIFQLGSLYHIKGIGYSLVGEITCEGKLCGKPELTKLTKAFEAVIHANSSEIDTKDKSEPEFIGDSTEISLLVAAEKAGFDTTEIKKKAIITEEIPFSAEKKFMAVSVKNKQRETVYLKGAPGVVLAKCSQLLLNGKVVKMTEHHRKEIMKANDDYSKQALRVIAVAYKPKDKKALDENLIFTGLFGIIDPPREDVAETIRVAKNAGIRIIMVTGDYGLTAAAIAKRIKLNENPKIYTGDDLNEINDKDLREILKQEDLLFSRVDPIHKLRIVKVLQEMGNTVAVTGDGVNDAPALKKSDIGVAMGITGTDVSKEAAEMVSLNDSFSSIVWAIKEGRIVYENIKKVTRYVFTSNIAQFVSVCVGLIFGVTPILAIQILLVDLGAEVFPALALAGDVEEDNLMNKPPRNKKDRLFGAETIVYFLRSGGVMGLLATCAFVVYGLTHGWNLGGNFPNNETYVTATTMTYATIAICQYINSISIRSQKKPFWKLFGSKRLLISLAVSVVFINSLLYIPFLQNFAHMKALTITDWLLILPFGLIYLIYMESFKWFNREPKKLTKVITGEILAAEN